MIKAIHIVGKFAFEDKNLIQRSIKSQYRDPLEITAHVDNLAFANAVRPDRLPAILVLGNRLTGMDAGGFAAKLRSEGYAGRIFLYTGDHGAVQANGIDGVFYKPGDVGKFADALVSALHDIG